ncbi:MAG: hypothetical protein R3F17_03945 [Planctomycetota bacterium]
MTLYRCPQCHEIRPADEWQGPRPRTCELCDVRVRPLAWTTWVVAAWPAVLVTALAVAAWVLGVRVSPAAWWATAWIWPIAITWAAVRACPDRAVAYRLAVGLSIGLVLVGKPLAFHFNWEAAIARIAASDPALAGRFGLLDRYWELLQTSGEADGALMEPLRVQLAQAEIRDPNLAEPEWREQVLRLMASPEKPDFQQALVDHLVQKADRWAYYRSTLGLHDLATLILATGLVGLAIRYV